MSKRIEINNLNIYYGAFHAVASVTMAVQPCSVTALIGPSGCGKSTVLRTLNRMHEEIPGARVEGKVLLDGEDIYNPALDRVSVRRTIGMVFQRPNPFPTMSIRDNVVAGLRLQGVRDRKTLDEVAERALRGANLWTEVKDRLGKPGASLSGGQQQRLCIARATALTSRANRGRSRRFMVFCLVAHCFCGRRVFMGSLYAANRQGVDGVIQQGASGRLLLVRWELESRRQTGSSVPG